MNKMCPGNNKVFKCGCDKGITFKSIRVRCPVCGRRIMSRVTEHDGHPFHHIPPHKIKEWYKSKNRVK
jgi:hypothetical protein